MHPCHSSQHREGVRDVSLETTPSFICTTTTTAAAAAAAAATTTTTIYTIKTIRFSESYTIHLGFT